MCVLLVKPFNVKERKKRKKLTKKKKKKEIESSSLTKTAHELHTLQLLSKSGYSLIKEATLLFKDYCCLVIYSQLRTQP